MQSIGVEDKYSMRVNQDYIYRGIGKDVEKGMGIDEQLAIAGLDWEPISDSFFYGDGKKSEELTIVYRSDNEQELTNAFKGWKPYGNKQFLRGFNTFCDTNGLEVERVGYLSRHKMAFAAAKIPKELGGVFMLDVDEVIESRIIFHNYHRYGAGMGCKILATRLICSNGMTAQVDESQFKLKHIASHSKDSKIAESLEGLKKPLVKLKEDLNLLTEIPMSPNEALDFLSKHFGKSGAEPKDQPRIVQTCFDIFQGNYDSMLENIGINLGMSTFAAYHTAYGLLQSVTAYRNHFCGGTQGMEGALSSLWHGESAKIQQRAYSSLVDYSQKRRERDRRVSVGVRGF